MVEALEAMPQSPGVALVSCDNVIEQGRSWVRIIYRREDVAGLLGLLVDPSRQPPVGGDVGKDQAAELAAWLTAMEMGEPRRSREEGTWRDEAGVTWRQYS